MSQAKMLQLYSTGCLSCIMRTYEDNSIQKKEEKEDNKPLGLEAFNNSVLCYGACAEVREKVKSHTTR
jgi:hypothetical protein